MTTTSRILATLNDYRARLAHHEAAAEATLNTAYVAVLGGIKVKLAVLYQQIDDAMQNGTQLSPSWLHESNRLRNIKTLISSEINTFGGYALMTAKQQQQFGVTLGSQSAQEMLKATVPAGIHWTWGRPSTEALKAFIGVTQKGSPLAELFNGFGAEAAGKVESALLLGLSLGQNPRRVAPQVEQALGISRNRALILSRDSLNNAYRNASLETYKKNSDTVSQYRRTCAKSSRSCAACIALDGTLYDLDEDFAVHPCDRCTMIPVTKDWSEILGAIGIDDTSSIPDTRVKLQNGLSWFDEQDAATQQSILGGKSKYDAFKNGDFTLSDVVGHTHSPDWGHGIYDKPLKDLVN